MELIKFIDAKERLKNQQLVVSIGQFDGLHIAHIKLLELTKQEASMRNIKSAILTFNPHPDFVLKKNLENTYITPLEEKMRVLETIGIDYMILVDFTIDVAKTPPATFVEMYLLSINTKVVIVGYDFVFGQKGSGRAVDINSLSGNLIETIIVPEISYHDEKIGSTKVRSLLKEGRVSEVPIWLGRYYHVEGTVIKGNSIGRTLSLPTANIAIDERFVPVKPAVYGVVVTFDHEKYLGIANIGHNPSFNYRKNILLEIHIINFNQDIYGKQIGVDFVMYLRDEKKFLSKEDFLSQIENDYNKTIATINLDEFKKIDS